MIREDLPVGDRMCAICRTGEPEILLLQPVDGRDASAEAEAA